MERSHAQDQTRSSDVVDWTLLFTAAWLQHSSGSPARDYPVKPVRIITGGVGTFHDIVTRQLGQRLDRALGSTGRGRESGCGRFDRRHRNGRESDPDGYTLVMSDRSALAVAPHLYRSVPYDPVRDFSPITLAALTPTCWSHTLPFRRRRCPNSSRMRRRQAREIHFATAGPGTNNHIAMELLKLATGVNAAPIHYKGGGASTQAIVSGEVKVGFAAVPSMLPHVKAGRVKAYVVTRQPAFPRRARDADRRGIRASGIRARVLDRNARPRAHAAGSGSEAESRYRGSPAHARDARDVARTGREGGARNPERVCRLHRQ